MTMQTKISHFQSLYREYLTLQSQDEILLANLKRRQEIMTELENFYFEGKWREYYDKIENGADIDLTTQGEYSIMSQDTLWNAFCDERVFYETLLEIAKEQLAKMDNNES